jgi:hypothetical protein
MPAILVLVLYPLRGVHLVVSAARSSRSNIPYMAILMPRGRDLALVVDELADLRCTELSPLLHYMT